MTEGTWKPRHSHARPTRERGYRLYAGLGHPGRPGLAGLRPLVLSEPPGLPMWVAVPFDWWRQVFNLP